MIINDFIYNCIVIDPISYDKRQCGHHMEKGENGVLKVVNDDPIIVELRNELIPQEGESTMPKQKFLKVLNGIIYSLIIEDNNDARVGIDILETLRALLGNTIEWYRPFEHQCWKRVIGLLKGYIAVDNRFCKPKYNYPNKVYDRAYAARNLKRYGVKVTLNNGDLKFENLNVVYSELENQIENIGGQYFITQLLATLQFKKEFGRFIIPKRENRMGFSDIHDPSIPYNYLLNTGLKYISSQGEKRYQTTDFFLNIIEFAKNICFATFTIESYSFWDNIFMGDKNPIEFITDFILQESVFNLNQSSLKFIIDFLKFICKNDHKIIDESNLRFTLNEYFWLVSRLAYVSDIHTFKTISIKELKNKHVREHAIRYIIDKISLPISGYNIGFTHPNDYSHVNFWNFPIAKIDKNKILLFPRSIMSRGWYEALISLIRDIDTEIDSKIGIIIENYLYYTLSKNNITCISGNYTLPNRENGECDALLESTKNIILIEVKKRSLIRDSRAGIDHQILYNLIDVIKSQVQCLKTSYGLRNDSSFRIKSQNSTIHEVCLGKRNIERMTLTLFPYGVIQDRVIFERIINIFLKYKFDVVSVNPEDDIEIKKQVESIRRKLKPFDKISKELNTYLDLTAGKRSLFDCWFMDLEQIHYLIRNSDSSDSFAENLLRHKHITTGSLDFYFEEIILNGISSHK